MPGTKNSFSEIVDRIALALGNRIAQSQTAKHAFAETVLRSIAFSEPDLECIPKEKGAHLLKKLHSLRAALGEFQSAYIRIPEAEGAHAKTKSIFGMDLMEVTNNLPKFLDLFEAELKLRTPEGRRGKDNNHQLTIAKMVAINYRKFFKQDATTGKGNTIGNKSGLKLKKTPYDRVCDIIEDEFVDIGRITNSTRTQAILIVKNGGEIRPHKDLLFYPAIFKGARGKT